MYKSHTCGELRQEHIGLQVTLAGWVNRRRSHGGITFLDLRDRFGIVQVVTDPSINAEADRSLDPVRMEWVIQVTGEVRKRLPGAENPNMPTGEVEVLAGKVVILNPAKTPPMLVYKDEDVEENFRLKYRYLDLRRERMRRNLELRHRVVKFIRDYLDERDFLEIETPILFKTTPEGARDYLVPSRVHPGRIFCPAPIAAAAETIADGSRYGTVFPDCPLFQG